MQQIFDKIQADPDTLLPRHQYLLEVDHSTLGRGSTATRRLRLATLKSAKSVADLSQSSQLTATAEDYFSSSR
jgi:hypothetical protein